MPASKVSELPSQINIVSGPISIVGGGIRVKFKVTKLSQPTELVSI